VAHTKVEPVIAAMDPKFDFYCKNLQSEAVEAKALAVMRVVYWMMECQENQEKANEKLTAFVLKIQQSKASDHFERVKQLEKNKI
jgi:hypothetical protein